jgi:hypothetical protein
MVSFWQPLSMFTKSKQNALNYKKKVSKNYPNKQFKIESNYDKSEWRVLFKNKY